MSYTIGSGDIKYLLSGIETKGYQGLVRQFINNDKPNYNALASPIDQLRTGAILEFNYLNHLADNFIFQHKATFSDMDVFVSSIDFAKIEGGNCVDFEELKTIFFDDYLTKIVPIKNTHMSNYLPIIKKKFKQNYNQIQCQLMCTGLQSANLVFLNVTSYDDEFNRKRVIKEKDYSKFLIPRDDLVISMIKHRGRFFQNIKDHFNSSHEIS